MDTVEDLKKTLRIGSRVTFCATMKTGEVFRIDEGGVFVFLPYGEKGYWPWSMLLRKFPRLVRRFPRTSRFPRLVPSLHCHCFTKSGGGRLKVDLRTKAVTCGKCSKAIGTESFPKRQESAAKAYERYVKAFKPRKRNHKGKPKGKVRKRTNRKRPALRRTRKRGAKARRHSS